jgi:hypothetical protein
MTTMIIDSAALRDELELRRRRLLNELDELVDYELRGRVNWQRRQKLVDVIERQLEADDVTLLRQLKALKQGEWKK